MYIMQPPARPTCFYCSYKTCLRKWFLQVVMPALLSHQKFNKWPPWPFQSIHILCTQYLSTFKYSKYSSDLKVIYFYTLTYWQNWHTCHKAAAAEKISIWQWWKHKEQNSDSIGLNFVQNRLQYVLHFSYSFPLLSWWVDIFHEYRSSRYSREMTEQNTTELLLI